MTLATTTGGREPGAGQNGSAPRALHALLGELNTSAGALAAITLALAARASGDDLAPELATAVERVIDTLGSREALAQLGPADVRSLLAEQRVSAASHRQLSEGSPPRLGWAPTCTLLIQAAGDVSAALPRRLERELAPRLPGLSERLGAPGARFLDVGCGAATLSIEMARTWPALTVVGLEPWGPALALAQTNVQASRLADRVTLRAESAEGIADEACYDLAWLPTFFIAGPVLDAALRCMRRALRPGAWLLLPVVRANADALASNVVRLRAALWGGSAPTLTEAEVPLREAGFSELHSFPSAAGGATVLVAARAVINGACRAREAWRVQQIG